MDFAEAFRVLCRRWRVTVPVLVATVIAVVATYVAWPTTYQSTAQLSLIANQYMADQPGNGNNPYVAFSDLSPLAAILVADLTSDQDVQQLAALGMTNGFGAEVPPFAAGPFVALTVTGPNRQSVQDSMQTVISFAEKRLEQLQESGNVGIPKAGLIRAVVISPASNPQPVRKRKIELMVGLAIAGLVVLLLLSFEAEGRAMRKAENLGIQDTKGTVETAHLNGQPGRAPAAEAPVDELAETEVRTP